jgi:hypothetical protein
VVIAAGGQELRSVAAPFEYLPAAGAFVRSGWIAGGTDAAGDFVAHMWIPGEGSTEVLRLPRRLEPDEKPVSAFLTAIGDSTLTATLLLRPFTSYLLHASGRVLARFEPETPSAEGKWVSLPLVPVGDFFVQTLSDLRSDRRALVLFEPQGCRLRTTMLDAPVALVGASFSHDTVYAIRDAGGPELVVYHVRVHRTGGGPERCKR